MLAPLVAILSAVSLSSLQRGIEWISAIAKTPQKGYLRQLRPYAKSLDVIIERILSGSKFTVSTTNILLMSLAILLLVLILENAEKPKRMIARTRGGADVKQE
eukprot:gene29117-38179_t